MARNHRAWQQPKFKTLHDSTVHTGQFPHVEERTQDHFYLCTGKDEDGNPCWHALNATLKEWKIKRHEKRTGHGYKRYEWKQGTRRPTTQEN